MLVNLRVLSPRRIIRRFVSLRPACRGGSGHGSGVGYALTARHNPITPPDTSFCDAEFATFFASPFSRIQWW